jgi:hypothetical protein
LRPKNETLNFQRVGSEPSAMSDHPARPEQEHDVRRATIREKFETTEALRRRDGIIQGVVWRRGRDLREMCYATCIIMVRTDESDELNILEELHCKSSPIYDASNKSGTRHAITK